MKKLNNKFGYWCAGWIAYMLHPVKTPISVAKATEILMLNEEEIALAYDAGAKDKAAEVMRDCVKGWRPEIESFLVPKENLESIVKKK
jgi:hypothetical protein